MSGLFRTDPVTGEPMLSADGMALLFGVPADEIRAHAREHGNGPDALPDAWARQGRRRAAEARAATGDDSMHAALMYYAQQTGEGADR